METNDYYYDVCYEVWKNGGNPDFVDFEQSENDYYNELIPEYSAENEINRQKNGNTQEV